MEAQDYHWRELRHVSFLSRQTTKHVFCRDKSMLIAIKLCLWQQNISVATKRFSRQIFVCSDRIVCPDFFWIFFLQIVTHTHTQKKKKKKKVFVATSILLSLQKTCICRDKTFLATKIKLVAAPANDTRPVTTHTGEKPCWLKPMTQTRFRKYQGSLFVRFGQSMTRKSIDRIIKSRRTCSARANYKYNWWAEFSLLTRRLRYAESYSDNIVIIIVRRILLLFQCLHKTNSSKHASSLFMSRNSRLYPYCLKENEAQSACAESTNKYYNNN